MQGLALCCMVALMASSWRVEATLPPPERAYKILVPIPAVRRNHWNLFKPLLLALADRGHQVVTLQTMESGFSHPNITEVVIPVGRTIIGSRFGKSKDAAGALALLEVFLVPLVSRFYSSPTVMEYYRRRKEFDVVITNHLFNEMAYPFAVGMPFITLTTNGVEPRQCAVLGNVLNPAYVPSEYLDYPRPYSLLHRLHNLYTILSVAGYWRVWGMMPKIQREVSAIFPDLPPLLEIERNVSLALLNSNFGNHIPVPLLPSQVEVGSMHCVPGTSLPQVSWPHTHS
ncbi:UDP-glycosyltransferase UGT5-like [Procambarus clarkii]|uniref:UDP-glycosyltransferase UGT5-like n=1 Tax=Procambarus clarkii TaxID=6728 RepID=UPI00374408C7